MSFLICYFRVTPKTHPSISPSDTVAEGEKKTDGIKQKEKKDPYISPCSTAENTCGPQRRTSNSWHPVSYF